MSVHLIIDSCWRHVRLAFRTLWKAPVFFVTAVLTLALGIGMTTALLTVMTYKPGKVGEPVGKFKAASKVMKSMGIAPALYGCGR